MNTTEINLVVLVYLVIAAAIATFIRFADYPWESITKADVRKVIVTFIGSLIAGFVTLFMLMDGTNASIEQWQVFATVAAASVGGVSAITAAFAKYGKANTGVVPPN